MATLIGAPDLTTASRSPSGSNASTPLVARSDHLSVAGQTIAFSRERLRTAARETAPIRAERDSHRRAREMAGCSPKQLRDELAAGCRDRRHCSSRWVVARRGMDCEPADPRLHRCGHPTRHRRATPARDRRAAWRVPAEVRDVLDGDWSTQARAGLSAFGPRSVGRHERPTRHPRHDQPRTPRVQDPIRRPPTRLTAYTVSWSAPSRRRWSFEDLI